MPTRASDANGQPIELGDNVVVPVIVTGLGAIVNGTQNVVVKTKYTLPNGQVIVAEFPSTLCVAQH